MLRKSLILGSMTLLLVMLFAFTGCEGPVGPAGSNGPRGAEGPGGPDGPDFPEGGAWLGDFEVKAVDLKDAFAQDKTVVLKITVETVTGEVPAGRTLYIMGTNTKVDTAGLTIKEGGTLYIWGEDAALAATDVNGIGVIKAEEGAIFKGEGALILPYVFDGGEYTAGLHYASGEVKEMIRYPGSSVRNAAVTKLTSADVKQIFEDEDVSALTVQDIDDLQPLAIPSGRTLTLKGAENTVDQFFLIPSGSALVIASSAKLEVNDDFQTAAGGSITNNGTIDVIGGSVKVSVGNSFFINNGTIESSTGSDAEVTELVKLEGVGTIVLKSDGAAAPVVITGSTFAPFLEQNLIIAPSDAPITLNLQCSPPLSGVAKEPRPRTITLANEEATLLISNTAATGLGTTVINKGLIKTDMENSDALLTLFEECVSGGKIESGGDLEKFGASGLNTKSFIIPDGITFTITGTTTAGNNVSSTGDAFQNDSTLDSPVNVTVNGTLVLKNGVVIGQGGDSGGFFINGELRLEDTAQITAPLFDVNRSLVLGTGTELHATALQVLRSGVSSGDAGVGGLIVVNESGITIDDIPGNFGTPVAGVYSGNFFTMFSAIQDAIGRIKRDRPNSGTPSLNEGIGTAAITAGAVNTGLIIYDSSVPDNIIHIDLPETVGVYAADNSNYGYYTDSSSNTVGNEFSIGTSGAAPPQLAITGHSVVTATGYVVNFNTVRFCIDGLNGLIGPRLEPFYVYVNVST